MLLAFLLCSVLVAGCGKKSGRDITGGVTPEVTDVPTEQVSPTPSPTPEIPFVKRAYETASRDDVYLVPVNALTKDLFLMSTCCVGDYVLVWLMSTEDSGDEIPESVLTILEPAVSNAQHSVSVNFSVTDPKLLADGTVILEDRASGRIHVYNNTLTEVNSFMLRGTDVSGMIDISADGTIWHTDKSAGKLLATGLNGQPAGEYAYDAKFSINRLLSDSDGRRCFLAEETGAHHYHYLYVSKNGEVSYRSEAEAAPGNGWNAAGYIPYSAPENESTSATWIFREPGYSRESVIFPKSVMQEEVDCLQNDRLLSCIYRWTDSETCVIDHLFYDMNEGTVSGVLSAEEFPAYSYLSAKGILDGGYVLFTADNELAGGTDFLLWSAAEHCEPISGFCDFRKDDPSEILSERLKEVEEYGIVITPDRMTDDGTDEALTDIRAEMDFINAMILDAKANPEVLQAKSGGALHPENGSNNDGAHYTFNRHVFSTFYLKEHGAERRDVFYRYVDALCAGEESFDCPNEGCANWSSGKFAIMFFPIAGLYADAEYIGNGRAKITYKIPKEEFLAKERDFEERITAILNDALEDDYSEFEKALALYEFLTEYTVYDYDMLDHNEEEAWTERQSAYRVLMERQGICGEIAQLYQYLALQCGVDMDECVGMPVQSGADMHAWDYINLGSKGYLLDATWGITHKHAPDLKYFLFTDELREGRDGYLTESVDVGFAGLYGARKIYSFAANDTRYSELWEGTYVGFDEDENCIFYRDQKGALHRFNYGE